MADSRQLIVGVYLDAQVREGVDELDQQRKFVTGVRIHMLPH